MVAIQQVMGAGNGIFFEKRYATAWNRTGGAVALNEVLAFDIFATQGETTNVLTEGDDASLFANLIDPATANIGTLSGAGTPSPGTIFGVVVDLMDGAGADNTRVRVQLQGIVKATMVATAITAGLPLYAKNGVNTLSPVVVAGEKILAIAQEANGSAAGTYQCLFDGIHGFGQLAAS